MTRTIRTKLAQLMLAAGLLVPTALVVLTTADTAMAQNAQAQAKTAYDLGKAKMDAGDYAGALGDFQRAESLWPGAAPKYNIAVCYDKLNRKQEAIGAYKTFINSNPGAKYADRVLAAQNRIRELEATAEGTVTVNVTPANIQGMAIKVDGVPQQGNALKIAPGKHTIEVAAPNYRTHTQQIDVVAGQSVSLPITLQPGTPTTTPGVKPRKKSGTAQALRIAGFVTLGVTVVGGALTTAFGVMALGNQSDFEATPTEELADDAESNALISDVFLGVTGAAGIATVILLAAGFSMKDGDKAGVEVTPLVSHEGGGAALTFSF